MIKLKLIIRQIKAYLPVHSGADFGTAEASQRDFERVTVGLAPKKKIPALLNKYVDYLNNRLKAAHLGDPV